MSAADPFPSEWTREVARALAVPFAAEQIGRKPQGGQKASRDQYQRCNTCKPPQKAPPGHFHVDYVDHAVVTGRLNDVVGPHGWAYTITSIERDQQGSLTAVIGEMTVLGHTKGPEVGGPGGQADAADDRFKSAISDYLKRAAARFGVGLDLWTKQALESAAAEGEQKPAARKESEPGGANAPETTPRARPDAEPRKAPDPSQGPVAAGTPPGFDHLRTVKLAEAWVRSQPEEWREAYSKVRTEWASEGTLKTFPDVVIQVQEAILETHRRVTAAA